MIERVLLVAWKGSAATSWVEQLKEGADRFLRFLDTLAVSDSTISSSFNPDDLRGGKMTVYLILPPEHMLRLRTSKSN